MSSNVGRVDQMYDYSSDIANGKIAANEPVS